MDAIDEAAQLLAAAQCETQYRTVASRSYYAAYNRVIPLAERLGFVTSRTSDDHQALIAFLKSLDVDLLKRIGFHRLPRCRRLRNLADYDQKTAFTHGYAKEAFDTAAQIIGWVDAIENAPASETTD
jgi:uncharacterized protein (UPF0332 family)